MPEKVHATLISSRVENSLDRELPKQVRAVKLLLSSGQEIERNGKHGILG